MTTVHTGQATSVNPATAEVIGSYDLDTPGQVDAALDRARGGQRRLSSLSFDERAAFLRRVAAELRTEQERLAQLVTAEMGKVIGEARAEIEKSAWACEYYAEFGAAQLAPVPVATDWQRSYVEFVPLGVVLAIMPWNYPVWQVIRAAAPTWMAGNAVVLKHASNVSGCALALDEVIARASGDLGALQVLLIESGRVADVIGDPRIAAVTLTGSEQVGVEVAGQCARHLKKSVLELGGSDAFIVLADADVVAAAEAAVTARFLNAGQSCIAGKRFIAAEAVADEFAERFAALAGALRTGDPLDARTDVGPMARRDLCDELAAQVRHGLAEGARRLCGAEPDDGAAAFFEPAVIDHVRPDGILAREETFGPAAAIVRACDDEEAISIANASRYGLSSSLWTTDVERGAALAPRIEAGAVFVNAPSASDPRMPFGGVKRSGWGRELGAFGIREFVNVQSVTVAPRNA